MRLCPEVSADKQVFTFRLVKLEKSPSSVWLELDKLEDVKLAMCKIEYDLHNSMVQVPQALMNFVYSKQAGFTIPVVWDRVNAKCSIVITFTSPVNSPVVLNYDTASDLAPITDFWMSDIFTLGSEQSFKMEGVSQKIIVEFMGSQPELYDCALSTVVNTTINHIVPVVRRWGEQSQKFVVELKELKGSREFLIKTSQCGRVRLYSPSATPLIVTMTTKRKVVLRFEDEKVCGQELQELVFGEDLPAWTGQTVMYYWSDLKPLQFFKAAALLTHVIVPKFPTPKQQAQLAVMCGCSVEGLNNRMMHALVGREFAL
jgi:hypothetical protein